MGRGKKTSNRSLKKISEVSSTVNSSISCRNLPKNELGAVIFGCKHHTFSECLQNKIFGLPASHYSYVKNITPDLKLFLFNYSDRILHGIFKAVSCGQRNTRSRAWTTSEGTEYTRYAAQVQVDDFKKCLPLSEEQFKPIIANNYYENNLFWFELDKGQTGRLVNLFLSSPALALPNKMACPSNGDRRNSMFDVLSSSGIDEATEEENSGVAEMKITENVHSYAAVGVIRDDGIVRGKKWADFFKAPQSSYAVNNDTYEDITLNTSTSNCFDPEWELASSDHETSKLAVEACRDAVNIEYESDVECWEEHASDGNHIQYESNTNVHSHEQDNDWPDLTAVPNSESKSLFDGEVDELVGPVVANTESSDFESVTAKLMREIEGLKIIQLKQEQKINSLEHELVRSKFDINELMKGCHKLDTMPSSAWGHCNVEDHLSPDLTTEESVLIHGGFDGSSWLQDLSLYSPSQDNITSLCPMTFLRSHASVAKLNDELYVLGGGHDGVWYDTVEMYHLTSNRWVQQPSLSQKKGSLAAASMHEKIFAIGGGNGVECFSEVELFDINIGRWTSIQSMLEKRFSPAAADLNGSLYVTGGYNGKHYLRAVERFDPREHGWNKLGDMNTNRGCHCLVAFKEKLYAIGGYDGDAMVSTVEVFDPRFGSWMMVEPMTLPRGFFGSFIFGEKIYVTGGLQYNEVLDVVECYEEGSGWQVSKLKGFGKRSSFANLVL